MSFVNQGKPARIKSVYGHNTGTAAEPVYTCPANCVAEITFIHVVNGGNSTNTIEVEWYVAADNYTSHFLNLLCELLRSLALFMTKLLRWPPLF